MVSQVEMSAFSSNAEEVIERQVVIHPRKERNTNANRSDQLDFEIERCVEWVRKTKKECVSLLPAMANEENLRGQ